MVRVVCDTTASLTIAELQSRGITPVPLYVREGEATQRELLEMSYDEFYRQQRAGARFSTSAPEPNAFLEAFRTALDAGDDVVCVVLSSKISGTINVANVAAQMLDPNRVSVVDSRGSGFGQGMLACTAAEMGAAGERRAEIVAALEDMRARTRTYFVPESLRYLYEGGRLSGAQALIGSLIQMKPIITFEADGTMDAMEKIRTSKAAKARLLELVAERAVRGVEQVALHYGDNLEEATEFAARMEEVAGRPVSLVKLSPVIGSHTGPDLLGPCIISAT